MTTLLLPDWHGAEPAHWLSQWAQAHGYVRVEQHDWQRPLRGDWLIQLEEAVLASPEPVVLVAHGLACEQVAAWVAVSQQVHRVQAALLVAPTDVTAGRVPQQLPGWAPLSRGALPFAALVLASRNDPMCAFESALALAHDWGAEVQDMGSLGHMGAALGAWPQGHACLDALRQRTRVRSTACAA